MGFLPIFLDVTGRPCVVIGGGEVAERKTRSLLDAGASVTIVSPGVTLAIERWSAAGRLTRLARSYRSGDIAGAALVFAATGDPELHRAIADEARQTGTLINVVDVPELCTFIVPAVAARGALQIAVSTSGATPAFAARVRDEIEDQFGEEYGLALEILRGARSWIRSRIGEESERARIMKTLANSDLPSSLRSGDFAAIDRILAASLGDGVNLATLNLELPKIVAQSGAAITR